MVVRRINDECNGRKYKDSEIATFLEFRTKSDGLNFFMKMTRFQIQKTTLKF